MLSKYKYILFDLDGTLTESGTGIINAVKYALKSIGIDEKDEDVLRSFIGPPLVESFSKNYGKTTEESFALQDVYREYYNVKGVFENEPYPGVIHMLKTLKENGAVLALATSKPLNMSSKVLNHFDMARFFDIVVCGEDEGRLFTKAGVIEEALIQCAVLEYHRDKVMSEYKFDEGQREEVMDARRESGILEKPGSLASREEIAAVKKSAVMIGDRMYDIEGALSNGIDAIGALWGYAEKGELEKAGAVKVCVSAGELEEYLTV